MRFLLLSLLIAPAALAADVNVIKPPPKVTRTTFDPAKPPKDMPPLKEGERAITKYEFQIVIDVRFAPGMVDNAPGGGIRAAATIHGINIRLALPIGIWNPTDADAHLKAHEEGHATLALEFYKDADKAARAIAQEMTGRRVEGIGPDRNTAMRNAIEPLSRRISDRFLETVMKPCDEVQASYDALTEHSNNRELTSEKAVQQVLEEWRKSQPKKK